MIYTDQLELVNVRLGVEVIEDVSILEPRRCYSQDRITVVGQRPYLGDVGMRHQPPLLYHICQGLKVDQRLFTQGIKV